MLMFRRVATAASPIAALLSALLAVSGCTGHGAVKQDVSDTNGYTSGNLALNFVAASHRHSAPNVTGTLLDGSPFDLTAWRGKVVVVNFWGSWCAECHAEAQALQEVYAVDRSRGVEFLGVDIRDDVPSATQFNRKYAVTYPSLNDPDNLVALRFHGIPPDATPTTLVLDRNGRVAARQSGEILYSQLRDLVDKVLAERA